MSFELGNTFEHSSFKLVVSKEFNKSCFKKTNFFVFFIYLESQDSKPLQTHYLFKHFMPSKHASCFFLLAL